MKNIVVTGGAGFIGFNLIKSLLSKYNDVNIICVDNYFTGKLENHINDDRVKYININTWDINEDESLINFETDYLFHLGEYSRIVQSFNDIQYVFDTNQRGTFEVLQYWRTKKCKLIYAGSSSKFGNDMEDQHLSPYAWTKSKNSELIKNYSNWFDLDYAITYFYNVYGEGHIRTGPYSTVIAIFENQYLNNKPLTVVHPGNQKRDFTHVDDIISGILKVMESGSGDDYLLGTGTNYTIEEVAKLFNHSYVFIPERTGERFTSRAYESRATTELGWKSKVRLEDYIKQWLEKNEQKN